MRRPDSALQHQLLAPFGLAGVQVRAAGQLELLEQRAALARLRQRLADDALDVGAEDRAGGLVRGAHGAIGLQRNDAGRQAREDDCEVGALGLDRVLTAPRLLARTRQPLRHVVERMHQDAHLVVRGERQAHVEVALRDRARAGHEILDRTHQTPRGPERAVQRGEQRQQQHQGQRQREAGLQRLAQPRLLAVALICRLDGVGELAEATLDGIDGFEHARLVAGRGQRHLHGGAHEEAAARDRIERHVFVPRLHDHFFVRALRHDLAEALGAGAENAAVRAEQRELDCLVLAARFVEHAPAGHRAAASSSAIVRVRCMYSRMRRSSAARDSVSASSRPWRISTWNQLSMPRLRNITEK